MLKKIYPRAHARVSSLPLLGQHVEGFVSWLHARGYPPLPIRRRLSRMLRRRRIARIEELTAERLLSLAPKDAQDDLYLSAVVRSLARYFTEEGRLALQALSSAEELVAAYVHHLQRVRGLAESTWKLHQATASELLAFVGFDGDGARLQVLGAGDIERFLRRVGRRVSKGTLQHVVGYLRSFLRFLAGRGLVASGLDTRIDTPRLYRGERLPRTLPWDLVRRFLAAIDRSTPMGKRDFAMFMLMATYGLRTSEVAGLRLDDVHWRTKRLHVPRPKTGAPLVLPLTDEVGAALIDYLRHGRPQLPHRQVFLCVRAPSGPLGSTTVTEAFRGWVRRSGLPIPNWGSHCLRHSLAVHLLRQGAPLKAISDLLGHRSAESTCVYLRLHVEDLRDVALDLPRSTEAQP